ncbi:hypothetical protein NB697_000899 [Xanthomonas sacchari]|uniref:RHS repeat domain-containing protein n=1 Tax=Xanthomonas sacchari TaxID=56458 RepID=UPI0031BCACA3|nr:hypothetical protein [Xanthomonas sacchari]
MAFDYDAADRLTETTLPNGVKTGYAYNTANQTTGIAWLKPDGTALGEIGYGYDQVGRLVAQTGSFAPQALPAARSGGFDDNNRQTQADGQTLSYDANGNLVSDGVRTYVWNARDQLVEIKQGTASIASFGYDPLGRRVSKTEGGQTISYLYDGLDAVQETQGGTVNPILTGLGIDERYARNEASGRAYFLSDALGSTRAVTNASGALIQRYDYTPYGQTSQANTGTSNPYQYTGRERDASGLYYYRARYYRSDLARFISEDPIGLEGGANPYAYVVADPLSNVDPMGLAPDPLLGYKPAYGPIIFKTPTKPIGWVERMISSLIIGKLSLGTTSVNKFGKLVPKPSTLLGRASVYIMLMEPYDAGCAELDCDRDGVADFMQRENPNMCLEPGSGMSMISVR